ncbi:VanZ family protein [Anaerosacchariphilus polymeriproducens]|uniref:VanZ family protein n=1 Tax=Anaerosacchariphilus polymeriproducens TaxID=1812858 RepID=A0A371B0A6_9FIRM|nr:VanZ family protein [Anaerosacchariphilus polymeriproducens]RDU25239.1 VanZ family protein [Anaerosacchariphilus polymeriproducens]
MLKQILKPFSFIPALIIMYFIFSFSGQTGDISGGLSFKISHKIITIGDKILNTHLDSEQINDYAEKIHTPVRKVAHMTEYFLLTMAVSFPLYLYGIRGIRLILFASIFCFAFACSDEFHQSFISGRGPSIKDVGIDSIGILIGIFIIHIFKRSKINQ